MYSLTPVAHFLRSLKPGVVGTDFAGTVESVGKAVTLFRPGDEVFGGGRGAFAEYMFIPERKAVVRKPAGLSFEQAATVETGEEGNKAPEVLVQVFVQPGVEQRADQGLRIPCAEASCAPFRSSSRWPPHSPDRRRSRTPSRCYAP